MAINFGPSNQPAGSMEYEIDMQLSLASLQKLDALSRLLKNIADNIDGFIGEVGRIDAEHKGDQE